MFVPPNLGGYVLHAKLGEGPFGMVYQARHAETQAPVYLKVMHPALAAHQPFRDRWLDMQQALQSWEDAPPGLLLPHAVSVEQDFAFVVLSPWPHDLRQELVLHGVWEPARAVVLVRAVGRALPVAHARGWFHGNIKPSNVLLDDTASRVALVDLGWMQSAVATWGSRLGDMVPPLATALYVPPEVHAGVGLSARSDVYGLAQLLHELLSGRAFDPSQWETHAALLERWGDLAPALRAGLHPNPGHRPDLPAWLSMLPDDAPRPGQAAEPPLEEPETVDFMTAEETETWSAAQETTPLGEVWRAPGQNMAAATPEFPDWPTPEEAEARAAARDATWEAQAEQAAAAPPRRQNWLLGCGIFALIGLLLVCGLAGIGTLAWKTLEPQIAALLTPQPTAIPQAAGATPVPREVEPQGAEPQEAEAQARAWYQDALQRPPDFIDDFERPGQLPDDDRDANGVLDYDQGRYVIHVVPDSYILAGLFDPDYTRVVMQVQVRLPRAPEDLGDGSFGFICGLQNQGGDEAYYTLDVSEDGYVGVWHETPETLSAVYGWEPLDDIFLQPLQRGEWFTMTGVCGDGLFALWLDDQPVFAIRDADAEVAGQVGLFVNTLNEDDLLVEFDNFRLWEIAP